MSDEQLNGKELKERLLDYRSMYDREYVGAWDLPPEGGTVTIERVEARELNNGKTKNKKPVIFFRGRDKGFALNKTNGKTIAAMYGPKVADWVGKKITIYPTTTQVGGETVECIRVKPGAPK